MEIIDYLLARKKAGGGSDVTIEQLSVAENGTYSEQGIAYSPVVVNVPTPANSYQLKNLPSGTVSTIEDGTALPMPSLKVGIEPAQDLHGYDHPWAGGAGKNLFNIDAEHTVMQESYMYEVYVKPNTSYTLSSNCPSSSPANLYFNGGSTEVNGVGLNYPKTFNSDEDGKLTIYVRYKANTVSIDLYTAVKNGQYYIQLEEGSTATTYEPYSNICPISGWTAAKVVVSQTTSAEDGTTYTIEFKDGDNPLTVYGGTLDVTTGELVVDWLKPDISQLNITKSDSGLFKTNSLTADIKKPISTLSASGYIKSSLFSEIGSTYITGPQGTNPSPNGVMALSGSGMLYFNYLATSDIDVFKRAMKNVDFIYELATPATYHLTPTQIRTLVGNNNIWADTGDIIEGKYFKSLT